MLVSLMVLPLICCIQRRLIRPCRHIMEVMILIACTGRPLRQVRARLAIALLGARLLLLMHTFAYLGSSLMLNLLRCLVIAAHAVGSLASMSLLLPARRGLLIHDLAAVGGHVLVLLYHGLGDARVGLVQALLRLRHDLDILRIRVGDLSSGWLRLSLSGWIKDALLALLWWHLWAADVPGSMVSAHERRILFIGRVAGVRIFLAMVAQVVACVAPTNATIVYGTH